MAKRHTRMDPAGGSPSKRERTAVTGNVQLRRWKFDRRLVWKPNWREAPMVATRSASNRSC